MAGVICRTAIAHPGWRRGPAGRQRERLRSNRGLEKPNDSLEISGPRRAWAAALRLSKARLGRRSSDPCESWRPRRRLALSFASTNGTVRRALTPIVELQANQIEAPAKPAQSITRLPAPTYVSARAEGCVFKELDPAYWLSPAPARGPRRCGRVRCRSQRLRSHRAPRYPTIRS